MSMKNPLFVYPYIYIKSMIINKNDLLIPKCDIKNTIKKNYELYTRNTCFYCTIHSQNCHCQSPIQKVCLYREHVSSPLYMTFYILYLNNITRTG